METTPPSDERKAHIQFLNLQELFSFCTYCTRIDLPFASDMSALKVIITLESWYRLPPELRKAFGTAIDAEVHKSIVKGTAYQRAQRRNRVARSTASFSVADMFEYRSVEVLLPKALMPRVE
ncbi:MAG: hypothetical protein AAB916_02275 [Patescibacteria group bacterium]